MTFIFLLIGLGLSAKSNSIKVTLEVSNNFGALSSAKAFIYEVDSLIEAAYVSKTGKLTVELEKNKEYLFVVSNPGHITARASLSTEKMYNDQIKKIYFPIKLYNVRASDIHYPNVVYKVKWNPILERFETFQLNLGWYDELKEKSALKQDILLESN